MGGRTDFEPGAAVIGYDDVRAAAGRIAGRVRPVAVASGGERLWFALEFLQHTGTFKARGALNFTAAARESGTMPAAGVTIASGGNAGLACAWAAGLHGLPATVFVPETAPTVKVARLRELGADVRQVGREYAEAAEACAAYAAASGALASHAYDHPLIAAGAGTVLEEILAARPGVSTVVVAAAGGGRGGGGGGGAAAGGGGGVVGGAGDRRGLYRGLEAGATRGSRGARARCWRRSSRRGPGSRRWWWRRAAAGCSRAWPRRRRNAACGSWWPSRSTAGP